MNRMIAIEIEDSTFSLEQKKLSPPVYHEDLEFPKKPDENFLSEKHYVFCRPDFLFTLYPKSLYIGVILGLTILFFLVLFIPGLIFHDALMSLASKADPLMISNIPLLSFTGWHRVLFEFFCIFFLINTFLFVKVLFISHRSSHTGKLLVKKIEKKKVEPETLPDE